MELIQAVVCVGFRPMANAGGERRERMLEVVQDSFLMHFKHAVVTDDDQTDGPFSRSTAKNKAARVAGRIHSDPNGVIVFADADTYAPLHQVEFAVRAVAEGLTDICFAHDGHGVYLSSGQVRGMGVGGIAGPFPGGVFAIRRSVFEDMGGWDEKFVGWGHEDLCFLWAASNIFGAKVMLPNYLGVGPFFKLDMLHPRPYHETELRNGEHDEEETLLYERNTKRRDAYLALANGDKDGYWKLRRKDIA